MHDTDAAGVLYFANQLRIAHEAFEAYMAGTGANMRHVVHEADYAVVIVHAEADYRAPLHVGDELTVEMTATHIGDSSFELDYRILQPAGRLAGTAKTVHVAIDRKAWKKRALPPEVRAAIERLAST